MSNKVAVLPTASLSGAGNSTNQRRRTGAPKALLCLLALCAVSFTCTFYRNGHSIDARAASQHIPLDAQEILMRCASQRMKSGPPLNFKDRSVSDRFEEGTPATLIRNATIWTGQKNGTEVIYGDLLLDKGIVKAIGQVPRAPLRDVRTVDAGGAWVTPGLSARRHWYLYRLYSRFPPLVDFHSHVGIYSLPALHGEFFFYCNAYAKQPF
jgi:hypothetical protein